MVVSVAHFIHSSVRSGCLNGLYSEFSVFIGTNSPLHSLSGTVRGLSWVLRLTEPGSSLRHTGWCSACPQTSLCIVVWLHFIRRVPGLLCSMETGVAWAPEAGSEKG